MQRATQIQFIALCILVFTASVGAQSSQSLPAGFLSSDGNGATSYPQNISTPHKWHWHYDSTQFINQGPQLISEIYVRAATPVVTVAAFSFTDWIVTLIEASTDYTVGSHDPVFANNILNSQVVRTGPWSAGPIPPSGTASATWIPMGLTSPFLYDPSSGNDLIIQIETCGTVLPWGTAMDGSSAGAGQNGGNRYGSLTSCSAVSSTFQNNEFVPCVKIDFTPTTSSLVVQEIRLTAAGAPISFNAGAQTFSLSGVVDSILTTQGILIDDPAIDPVVGATLTLSGSYAGIDLTGLTDAVFTPATLDLIVAAGLDELRVINQLSVFASAGESWALGGALNATPTVLRGLSQTTLNAVTRTGSGSGMLDSLNSSLQSDVIEAVFSINAAGPSLAFLAMNFVPTTAAPQQAFATDGGGSLEIGLIGLTPISALVNFVDVNPLIPQGSGPLFGLNFGPSQFEQLTLPFPTPPILDVTTPSGTYSFQLPTGSLPPALVIDLVSIEIPTGGSVVGFVSNVVRVVF